MKNLLLWIVALVVGAVLGLLGLGWLNSLMDFVATVYTRLFQLLAVPTIALAVITTLTSFGRQKDTGRIFGKTLFYTLFTTVVAAAVGLLLYVVVAPENLSLPAAEGNVDSLGLKPEASFYDHILAVIPNNVVRPFLEGNVLSILLVSIAVGLGLARLPETEGKQTVVKFLQGLQELLFLLIRGLIWTLPLGIVAFSAQLSSQLTAGVALASLGKYVAVILGGNAIQFFVVLPLFLLARGINPLHTFRAMMPAVLMALFTKSSAATLPVKMVADIRKELGHIDILVNNAGIIKRIPMHEMKREEFQQVIDIDLVGPFIMTKAVIPEMMERKEGKIINICSMMSELGRETVSAYAAAKGGLKMLTRNICSEYGEYNIQCNAIGPGYIATPQTAPLRERQADGSRHPFDSFICAKTPAGRWLNPEELAGPAVFLASHASDAVNGHILYVDGGILAYIGKQPK